MTLNVYFFVAYTLHTHNYNHNNNFLFLFIHLVTFQSTFFFLILNKDDLNLRYSQSFISYNFFYNKTIIIIIKIFYLEIQYK